MVIPSCRYERIGRLAVDYYVANTVRDNARKQRARQRQSHPCEIGKEDYALGEYFCWNFYHKGEWCANCLSCQPYHEAYMQATSKARVAKCQLTKEVHKLLLTERREQ